MKLDESRFPIEPCPGYRCTVRVVRGSVRGVVHLFEAQPHSAGNYQLRDAGGEHPLAVLLTTVQQFGKQGMLHRKHNCPALQASKRRR